MTACAHPLCAADPQPATHTTPRGLPLCAAHAARWDRDRAARPLAQQALDLTPKEPA